MSNMSNPFSELPDLQKWVATKGFLQEVQVQIEKDCTLLDVKFESKDPGTLEEIALELLPYIIEARGNKPDLIMKAINRVDLTEKQMRRVMNYKGDYNENLCKGIVLREFQKVVFRHTL